MQYLKERDFKTERMDDPSLAVKDHHQALRGLERVNKVSFTVSSFFGVLEAFARVHTLTSLRILDIATGSGDIPIGLAELAKKKGYKWNIYGSDLSENALEHARARATQKGVAVDFFQLDLINHALPNDYDVIINSLFLHHLPEETIVNFLRKIYSSSVKLVILNDLIRCRRGFFLAHIVPKLLTASKVVHWDAVQSVRNAFTLSEIETLALQAGVTNFQIKPLWPSRYFLIWQKP